MFHSEANWYHLKPPIEHCRYTQRSACKVKIPTKMNSTRTGGPQVSKPYFLQKFKFYHAFQ